MVRPVNLVGDNWVRSVGQYDFFVFDLWHRQPFVHTYVLVSSSPANSCRRRVVSGSVGQRCVHAVAHFVDGVTHVRGTPVTGVHLVSHFAEKCIDQSVGATHRTSFSEYHRDGRYLGCTVKREPTLLRYTFHERCHIFDQYFVFVVDRQRLCHLRRHVHQYSVYRREYQCVALHITKDAVQSMEYRRMVRVARSQI